MSHTQNTTILCSVYWPCSNTLSGPTQHTMLIKFLRALVTEKRRRRGGRREGMKGGREREKRKEKKIQKKIVSNFVSACMKSWRRNVTVQQSHEVTNNSDTDKSSPTHRSSSNTFHLAVCQAWLEWRGIKHCFQCLTCFVCSNVRCPSQFKINIVVFPEPLLLYVMTVLLLRKSSSTVIVHPHHQIIVPHNIWELQYIIHKFHIILRCCSHHDKWLLFTNPF